MAHTPYENTSKKERFADADSAAARRQTTDAVSGGAAPDGMSEVGSILSLFSAATGTKFRLCEMGLFWGRWGFYGEREVIKCWRSQPFEVCYG